MKLKTPTSKTITDTLVKTVAVVGGMVLANGIAEVIPLDNKTIAKATVGVVGAAGAASVTGTDTLAKAIEGVCLGMAAQQGKEIIKESVAGSLPANDGTIVKKFINGAFEQTTTSSAALGARRTARRRTRTKKMGAAFDNVRMAAALDQPQAVRFAMI